MSAVVAYYIPTKENNLLSPIQMRLNDVKICEVPKFLAERPSDATHAITAREMGTREPCLIPMSLQGANPYFPTRKPSTAEYERGSFTSEVRANF